VFTAVSIVFTENANGGRHVWDVKPSLRSRAVLCMWVAQFTFLGILNHPAVIHPRKTKHPVLLLTNIRF
jgi:hypothetical protein